jgi:hypothetical protein
VCGQEHSAPCVDDGLVGEVEDDVRPEPVEPGEERCERVGGDDDGAWIGKPVVGCLVDAQLLAAAQPDGADDVVPCGSKLVERGPHDRWIVLAVDEHERARA